MRSWIALALVLTVAAAGCFGGGGGKQGASSSSSPTGAQSGTGSASGTPSAPGAPVAGFTWTPAVPRAGEAATFHGNVSNLGKLRVEDWGWSWGDGNTSSGSPATHAFAKAGDWNVRLNVLLSDGRTITAAKDLFVLGGAGATVGNGTAGTPGLPPPGKFTCAGQEVVEPHETFGTDDALPSFSWMTLKTGFRFAALWTSEQLTTGSLTYSIGNGTAQTVAETVPTRVHFLVVDNVAEGRTLCFTASMDGVTTPMHAVRTVNGPTSFQPGAPHGSYTINLLAVVDEQGDVAEVEEGMAEYAKRLWDATDGWVRAGATHVVANNLPAGSLGWSTCYVLALGEPACTPGYDVVFTHDADPRGAASTYRKGIRDPQAAIWMNQYHQAFPGPLSLDDTGAVLTHEMGHYAFDMDDLYGDPVVPDSQDCDIPGLSMSIMGGPRAATEFDDEANPCPTQPASYVPSWTLMRGEFKQIPDRTAAPLAGPDGDGGLFLSRTYRLV